MTELRSVHFESLDALRANAAAWDDLWLRSDVTLPSLRAELLAQWVEQFMPTHRFHAIAIEADGRLMAALPLVERRVGRTISAGTLPSNEWSAGGDLLLDPTVRQAFEPVPKNVGWDKPAKSHQETVPRPTQISAPPVLDALAGAIRKLPWPLLWLDEATLDAPRWQQFAIALQQSHATVAQHPRWRVGRVPIVGDWSAYKSRWSRKHRQKMAWAARRLAQQGEVRLALHSHLTPDQVPTQLRRAFELEDHGWKGTAKTSVLQSPGMADFFLRQAEQAAQWGQLELAFLECGQQTVAFAYGLSAKSVFHSLKVSYDPQFAELSPGQLLRYYLLERFFTEPGRRSLDFQGLMTEAHAAWLPETYTIGRFAAATKPVGRLAVAAYRTLGPCLRAVKRSLRPTERSKEARP